MKADETNVTEQELRRQLDDLKRQLEARHSEMASAVRGSLAPVADDDLGAAPDRPGVPRRRIRGGLSAASAA